ncbi:hypothetical protein SAMN05444380_10622 [Thermophagus xiamenensis]|uniref:Uncharacterized protein n=1 Tax=Thermophagus xiamenensis TaxID=385682 RepID=A0A1I1XFG7_9BACT|nr:hypothetical protein SAMN05444380_10622 [Thermophagus xiamenensis]
MLLSERTNTAQTYTIPYCLNPCFNGCCFLSPSSNTEVSDLGAVLILVLMDVAF